MPRNKSSPLQFQRRFVSEIELEQVTGISRRTWQKHRLFNRGPQYYKIYGSIRYDVEEVIAWIKALAVGGVGAHPARSKRGQVTGPPAAPPAQAEARRHAEVDRHRGIVAQVDLGELSFASPNQAAAMDSVTSHER